MPARREQGVSIYPSKHQFDSNHTSPYAHCPLSGDSPPHERFYMHKCKRIEELADRGTLFFGYGVGRYRVRIPARMAHRMIARKSSLGGIHRPACTVGRVESHNRSRYSIRLAVERVLLHLRTNNHFGGWWQIEEDNKLWRFSNRMRPLRSNQNGLRSASRGLLTAAMSWEFPLTESTYTASTVPYQDRFPHRSSAFRKSSTRTGFAM